MNQIKNFVVNTFLSGLFVFAPIALSIYVLYSGILMVESILSSLLKNLLPEGSYIPGYGFATLIFIIFLTGFFVNNYFTAKFIKSLQKKLSEVPLIKTVYSPIRDLMNLFTQAKNNQSLQKVVLVHITESHSIIGLVTRESFIDLQIDSSLTNDKLSVFIPMSYGLGGYTLLVDKKNVMSLDMPIEKAMSLAVTAWIKTDSESVSKNVNNKGIKT